MLDDSGRASLNSSVFDCWIVSALIHLFFFLERRLASSRLVKLHKTARETDLKSTEVSVLRVLRAFAVSLSVL